jgi:hypothetical protein
MPDFAPITPAAFCAAIIERGSLALKREFARYTVADPKTWHKAETVVHRGPLTLGDGFKVPALHTLILGDLFVEGFVDADDGHDAGGVLVVIGNVECDVFAGQFGKCTFIDGNLEVTQLLLNSFADSSLCVTGSLRTHFFYGWDICAEVGGRAEMEYGDGYCLPFGHRDATHEAISPRHGAETSRRLLAVDNTGEDIIFDLLDLVRTGRSPFR